MYTCSKVTTPHSIEVYGLLQFQIPNSKPHHYLPLFLTLLSSEVSVFNKTFKVPHPTHETFNHLLYVLYVDFFFLSFISSS